jgi:hypothetical protein
MEIEITSLVKNDQFALSHSRHEGGDMAGRNTWQAALEQADDTPLLDTPEKLDAMRDFARASGGWDTEEIAEWSDQEVNALFLQWIAGDCRQCPCKLDGITFEDRDGEWYHSSEEEPDMETGPFESRSEAYQDARPEHGYQTADSLEEIDWLEYEEQAMAGQIPSNLFQGDDGKIYFTLEA